MPIKVMLVLSNMLLAEGIRKLLEDAGDLKVSEPLRSGFGPDKAVESLKPDVMLVDFASLYNAFPDLGASHDLRIILVDTFCGEENIIASVITKGVKGVLAGSTTPDELVRAVRAVAAGDVWLGELDLRNLLKGIHSMKGTSKQPLSDREWEVAALVGQGFRNKEIAERLCISEPTVKTHLQRIFQKLDIKSRPQLITYAIKKQAGTVMDGLLR